MKPRKFPKDTGPVLVTVPTGQGWESLGHKEDNNYTYLKQTIMVKVILKV